MTTTAVIMTMNCLKISKNGNLHQIISLKFLFTLSNIAFCCGDFHKFIIFVIRYPTAIQADSYMGIFLQQKIKFSFCMH